MKPGKSFVIDPKPLFSAPSAILFLVLTFILSTVIAGIFYEVIDFGLLSILVEVGVYVIPGIIIAMILSYPIYNLIRWRNALRIDVILITFFATFFVIIISAYVIAIIDLIFPSTDIITSERIRDFIPTTEIPILWSLLVVGVIPGISEEFLFRGIIQPALMKKFGITAGIIVTSLLFGLIHLSLVQLPALFILGLFLGVIAFKGGSFLYSAFAHMLYNSTAVVAVYMSNGGSASSGEEEKLSIALLVIVLVVFSVLMMILYRITPKRVIGEPDMYYI